MDDKLNNKLNKIIDKHNIYLESNGKCGALADLRRSDLSGVNLAGAYLECANLSESNLSHSNLGYADLSDADLSGADLSNSSMVRADLGNANLEGANLRGADLRGAMLLGAGLPDHTYVIIGEVYDITITNGEHLRADCKDHAIKDWRKFSKQEIAEMGGKKALNFYPRLLDIADFYLGKGERPEWLNATDSEEE